MKNTIYICFLISVFLLSGCSTTKHLPEGELLYTGIKDINYSDHAKKKKKRSHRDSIGVITSIADAVKTVDELFSAQTSPDIKKIMENASLSDKEKKKAVKAVRKADGDAFENAKTEVDAVLACPPNNSFFGSSSLRTPLPFGLWIYNSFHSSKGGPGRWLFKNFASDPVLVSTVNPDTRARVATNTLHNYGYFRGRVRFEVLPSKNPKKAKLAYTVKTNSLYRLDSISYIGFPPVGDSLIRATQRKSLLRKNDPFSVVNLSGEQARIEKLFRDNGFYYYASGYTTYRADTAAVPNKVQLQVLPIAGVPERVKHRWYVGKTYVSVRHTEDEVLTDSSGRRTKFYFSGKKIPLRQNLWNRNIHHRRGDIYSLADQKLTMEKLTQLNLFSQIDMSFLPRDTSSLCDTLDLHINAVMDKHYDGDFEMSVTQKSNDLIGPGLSFGLTRRNAFRGGEKIRFKVYGSYEWQTGRKSGNGGSALNSYEVGTQLSFDFPRVIFPGVGRRTFRFPASTVFSLNSELINRASYFNMVSLGAEWTYKWNKSATSKNEFTLLGLDFNRIISKTSKFEEIMSNNPALYVSMRDQFVPSMHYTYTFTSPSGKRNPVWWQTSVKEAGNLTSALYSLSGKGFNTKDKTLFNNPFAQFVKVSSELHTTFKLSSSLKLATRLMGGFIYSFGNSDVAPYSEQFFVGGANSVRGFTVRSIGPGRFRTDASKYSYMDQTGDLKLEANAELRFPIFGYLKGAIFVDAGNVWLIRQDEARPGGQFKLSDFLGSVALSTGAGLRYDMDFLVLRLDLGVALHNPSETSSSGYFNIAKFTDGLSLHFAIGYPF